MSLIEWSPFKEIDSFSKEINNFFNSSTFKYLDKYSSPRVDIYQNDKDIIVKAEIPGIQKEDLNVYVEKDSLQLSGQKQRNSEFKDENIYRAEQFYGSFSRTIPLPAEVISDKAHAEYKDGILSIVLPKSDKQNIKGTKITIQ